MWNVIKLQHHRLIVPTPLQCMFRFATSKSKQTIFLAPKHWQSIYTKSEHQKKTIQSKQGVYIFKPERFTSHQLDNIRITITITTTTIATADCLRSFCCELNAMRGCLFLIRYFIVCFVSTLAFWAFLTYHLSSITSGNGDAFSVLFINYMPKHKHTAAVGSTQSGFVINKVIIPVNGLN